MIWVLGCVVVTAFLGLFSLQWPGAEVAPVLDALWPFGHVLESPGVWVRSRCGIWLLPGGLKYPVGSLLSSRLHFPVFS